MSSSQLFESISPKIYDMIMQTVVSPYSSFPQHEQEFMHAIHDYFMYNYGVDKFMEIYEHKNGLKIFKDIVLKNAKYLTAYTPSHLTSKKRTLGHVYPEDNAEVWM